MRGPRRGRAEKRREETVIPSAMPLIMAFWPTAVNHSFYKSLGPFGMTLSVEAARKKKVLSLFHLLTAFKRPSWKLKREIKTIV